MCAPTWQAVSDDDCRLLRGIGGLGDRPAGLVERARAALGPWGRERLRPTPQGVLEDLVHRVDEDDLELLPDLVRNVPEVLLVLARDDDHLRAREMGRQDLALEPADREDPAAEGDLAGHGEVLPDGDPGEGRDHGRGHRDPGGRAVLGDRAGRDVDVEGLLLERLPSDPERRGVGPDPRQAGASRLAHDLAELAGEDEVLLALHAGDLDGDGVAADPGPHEPGRRADLVLGLQPAIPEPRRPEELDELLLVDDRLALAALGDASGDLA